MGSTALSANLEGMVGKLFGGMNRIPDRLHKSLLGDVSQSVIVQIENEELGVWSPNQCIRVLVPPFTNLLGVGCGILESIFGDGSFRGSRAREHLNPLLGVVLCNALLVQIRSPLTLTGYCLKKCVEFQPHHAMRRHG